MPIDFFDATQEIFSKYFLKKRLCLLFVGEKIITFDRDISFLADITPRFGVVIWPLGVCQIVTKRALMPKFELYNYV